MGIPREELPPRDSVPENSPAQTPATSPNLYNLTRGNTTDARQALGGEEELKSNTLGGLLTQVEWFFDQSGGASVTNKKESGQAIRKGEAQDFKVKIDGGRGGADPSGTGETLGAGTIELPLNRVVNNRDGSSVQFKDGNLAKLTTSQGEAVEFKRDEAGAVEKITVGDGKKEIAKGEDGRWYLTQKDSAGKEQKIELKNGPTINKDGSFSIETKDGIKQTFKTDGSTCHTNTEGRLVQVDYADGGKKTIQWKGEGKNAKENIIRVFRPDGSRSEQYQQNNAGTYDRFSWERGATHEQYKREGTFDRVATYKTGEIYTFTPGATKGSYEHSDRTRVELDSQERVTKITYANGETREFGYFDKGNELKWAKLPNGSHLSRDDKESDFDFITTDVSGRQTKSPGKLQLKMENGVYSWRKTDGSDPHTHTYLSNGKEMLETAGGGKAITGADGKVEKYVYPLNGREVSVNADGKPTRITEKDGSSWALTDADKNQWTSSSGEKRELTVKDGEYSYKDENNVTHTFKRNGTEELAKSDGSKFVRRGDRIITGIGTDGRSINYRYDKAGVSLANDENGTLWTRKEGTNEWTRTRGGKSETLTGTFKVNSDGTYSFDGKRDGKDIKLDRRVDGVTTESTSNQTIITKGDGNATKITYHGEGDKRTIGEVARLDKEGKELFRFVRSPGAGGLESTWKSERRGDFKGDITVADRGDLQFKKENSDKSVATLDEKMRTIELQLPGGGIRKFEYDGKDNLNAELQFKNKDDKNPVAWKREGLTSVWKASDGSVWSGKDRLAPEAGIKWERKAGGDNEWNVTRGGKTETLKGNLKVEKDGSYTFDGTSGDTKVKLEYKPSGNLIDKRGDETNVYYNDGTRAKITYEGDKRVATNVTRYDKDGKELHRYDRKAEGDPLKSTWKSEKKGDYQGDIKINDNGELIFTKQNADKTVSGTDEKGQLRERSFTDGTFRKFEYDDKGDLKQVTRYVNKDDKDPVVWTRQGNANLWTSTKGEYWEAKFEVKDGKYTIKDENGRKTKGDDGIDIVDANDKLNVASDLKIQKENILEIANLRIADSKELERFKQDMKDFEKRAKDAGLSDGEVARTYKEVTRMMITPGEKPVEQSDRVRAALHAMSHFADPTSIDQGWHNTCNVTTVETILCSNQPSSVARLLADVTSTGKFTIKDGTVITMDPNSLKPDQEANTRYPEDWKRSYASQLFQLTAVNIHWQRQTTLPDGTVAGRGNIQYTQITGPKAFVGDTRERLINTATGNASMTTDKAGVRRPEDSPYLNPNPLPDIHNQISGRLPDTLVIANTGYAGVGGAGVFQMSTIDQFHTKLSDLVKGKDRGADGGNIPRLPIVLCVHTSKAPFNGSADQGGAGGNEGGYHVVTITDYDPKTGIVSMDNQWGRRWDHLGRKDGKERIHIRDLYPATYKG